MEQYPEQASFEWMMLAVTYVAGISTVLLIITGLVFIDMGMVRRRNVLDTIVQKIGAAMVAGVAAMLFGYPIWQIQFYQALGVPSPITQAFKDWWLGGALTGTQSRFIDPAAVPEADVQQVFLAFFVVFSMLCAALVHTSVVERIKALPLYIMSFVIGGVLSPLVAYLCWGSLSPLTLRGVHDFEGIFPVYLTAGTVSLILSWRVGHRLGAIDALADGIRPAAQNLVYVAIGMLLILFALPMLLVGSGYLIPGVGFFGISFVESGIGILINNLFASLLGGGVVGLLIAYRTRQPIFALLGPLTGVIACGTLVDIGEPWECLLLGAVGPIALALVGALVRRFRLDDPKVVPLAFGPGLFGVVIASFIAWGTPTGGYIGMEGKYAPGVGEITTWWQLLAVVVTMAVVGIPTLVIVLLLEKTIGLRVAKEVEYLGADAHQWKTTNFDDDEVDALVPAVHQVGNEEVAPA